MKTNFSTGIFASLIILTGLAVGSCGRNPSPEKQVPETVNAELAQAELKEYPVRYLFTGRLEAGKQANLSTRIMGQIEQINVKPGQHVNKGEVLLRIRNQDILAKKAQVEAGMTEAKSAYENAKKDLARFEALYASKSTSDKEMDDIRTRYQMAEARMKSAEQMQNEVNENLNYTSVRAPYNGVITGKFVQEGDMANPGMPLLSIENPEQWQVIARIPEEDISRVKLQEPVRVNLDALEGLTVNGYIAEINPSTANTGPQFEAKIILGSLPANSARLYSGIYATVVYEKGHQSLMLIPQRALVKRGQLKGLYTVSQNGTLLLRWIRTGKAIGDSIEVLSGLTDGEKFVVNSQGRLYDGATVQNN
ncbi:MAG: efflux RND transporter periplasmic adaptor subunit [Prolixibacteraceae bacterium]